jgi:hypothetical protein
MLKNIDACKIGRASRSKAISHSYSGATVNQLAEKFGNHQLEQEFSQPRSQGIFSWGAKYPGMVWSRDPRILRKMAYCVLGSGE